MLRQSRLSGFFKQEQPKIVQSQEYQFENTSNRVHDSSRHRECFDTSKRKHDNQVFAIYTHAQLESQLQEQYGVQGQQLINLCLEANIVEAAGGKKFVTRYSKSEICEKLNEKNPGLAAIHASAKSLGDTRSKGKDLKRSREAIIAAQDRFAQRSKRSGSLTTDDLRKIPSYSFCLHPDIKIALNQLEREVEAAKNSGVVNTRLAQEWNTEINQIQSEKDYDTIARKVKAYLGK